MKRVSSNGNAARSRRSMATGSLNEPIDRAVALRDQEIGLSPPGAASAYASPGFAPVAPVPQPVPGSVPGFGVRDSGFGCGPANTEHRTPNTVSTFGIPGTPIISGFLQDLGEYNPELQGRNAIATYEKMRRGDAQVRATLAACKLPVQSAKWEVVVEAGIRDSGFGVRKEPAANPEPRTPNPVSSTGAGKNTQNKAQEIAAFVKENLFGGLEFRTSSGGWATQSWDSVVRNALLMLDFGCAAHEDVWTVDGDKIRLRKLAARLSITFYRWHTEADGETLLALEQYGYRRGRFLNALLPADKAAIFTYQQEGANFWGMALLRGMYPHWYVKSNLYRIDAIACERNSLGVPVFRLAPGFSKEDREAAYSFVTQLAAHEATGMVEPPGDAASGFRLVGYEGRLRDVLPSIEHHNVMISRAALAMFMELGQSGRGGSRALGENQGKFFLLALQSLADQIAAEITGSTVRRLVANNFGEGAPVPKLVAANVQARDLEEIVEALTQLGSSGQMISDQGLRDFIRKELALPAETREGLVAIRGETIDVGPASGEVSGKGGQPIQGPAAELAGNFQKRLKVKG